MRELSFSSHDSYPDTETRAVDTGLGEFNDRAAPLHEVQPVSCFVRDESGRLVGGAVGRWWGKGCELQQLWVEDRLRRQGLGAALIKKFEAHAMRKGCTSFYLETFSFQAPQLYERLGYKTEYTRRGFPHGIVKYHMVKHVGGVETAA
jgi:GNAT superfamily N-acetyltransferase